ncbi:MAG: hypothetical protein CMI35_04305, partial [Owenweeksia sp.]|nr:hypothetical protein [Owenweeksia sp.]
MHSLQPTKRILIRVALATWVGALFYGNPLRGQVFHDTALPFSMHGSHTFYATDVSDSVLAFYCVYKIPQQAEYVEKILFYNKADLTLLKEITPPLFKPHYGAIAVRSFKSNGDLFFYTNRWRPDTNEIHIRRWAHNQLQEYSAFTVYGPFINGFMATGNELVLITKDNALDSMHIDVRNLQGQRRIHNWLDVTLAGPVNNYTIIDPQQHPLNGNLIFAEALECNYAEVSLDSLRIVGGRRSVSVSGSGNYIFPAYVPRFEVTDAGLRSGGTGGVLYTDDPWNPRTDYQFYYAFRPWGDSVQVRQGFGPEWVNNSAYAFAYDEDRNTGFLAGSAPFDVVAFEGAEKREVLVYRFNDHGTDSIILYGDKNHVPLWMLPDDNGDLFIFSQYTEAWTTGEAYYLLTKIPGFAISLIEQHHTEARIELYPNPTTDYLHIDRLREEVLQMEIYSQSGQL